MTLADVERYDPRRVSRTGDHAIVVGGSVAGVTAARVLADAFDRVTVLEKDSIDDVADHRPGVPQARHIHVLQEAGRSTFEDLLPGFCEELLAADAVLIDGASDIQFFDEGGYLADGPRRMPGYSASRPLFESSIRRLVRDVDGLSLRSGCQVTDFCTDAAATAVTGVEIRDESGRTEQLSAALVVDATGRTSRTPVWLRENGYRAPPVAEVEIDVSYSTIAIERPPSDRRAYLDIATAPETRGGAAFPIENDQWLVNLHGVHDDDPPTDADAFQAFADSLPQDEIGNLLAEHHIVSESGDYYPFPSSRRRHYEALDRFPDGLLVVGDAIASFNPVYGQGMSVATLQALVLHHVLADGGHTDLARRFFARCAPIVDTAWRMAVVADHSYRKTTGPKPRGADLFNWYLSRLTRKAQRNGELRNELFRVFGMERSPKVLFRPEICWTVLRPDRWTDPRLGWESIGELVGALRATIRLDADHSQASPSTTGTADGTGNRTDEAAIQNRSAKHTEPRASIPNQ